MIICPQISVITAATQQVITVDIWKITLFKVSTELMLTHCCNVNDVRSRVYTSLSTQQTLPSSSYYTP